MHGEHGQGNARYLAASQMYFLRAGRWRTCQFFTVVFVPTVVAVFGVINRTPILWIPFVGFFGALLDVTLFNALISRARYQAAQIASMYDASLVGKRDMSPRIADVPPPERIIEAEQRYNGKAGRKTIVRGWHFPVITKVQTQVADLLYRRSDLGSSEQLRDRYVRFLQIVSGLALIALLVAAGLLNWNISIIFSNVLFPVVPAVAWLGREYVDHAAALARCKTLRRLLDEQLISAQLREVSQDPLTLEREALDGMMFMFRATQPSIPVWHYWLNQARVREALEPTIESYVDDAMQAGHSRHPTPPREGLLQG